MPQAQPKGGFTAEEMKEMEEGAEPENEGDAPEEGESQSQQTSKADPAPAASGKAADPAPKNDAPPPGYVPYSALHEERREKAELREKMARMEGMFQQIVQGQQRQTQPAIPDPNEDPVGHLQATLAQTQRQLQEITQDRTKQQQAQAQEGQWREVMEWYAADASNFAKSANDFQDAYSFLADSVNNELITRGVDDPLERARIIQFEEGAILARCKKSGKSPAKQIYDLAKQRGYKGTAPAAGADPLQTQGGDPNKLARLTQGMKGAKSLSGTGKAAADNPLTLERLIELADEDPDEFDKQFGVASRRGMLG